MAVREDTVQGRMPHSLRSPSQQGAGNHLPAGNPSPCFTEKTESL